jgi:hypothetical protein
VLKERTGLENIYLEQFRVFGDDHRIVGHPFNAVMMDELPKFDAERFDPEVTAWMTGRFVCIGFYALVDIHKVSPKWRIRRAIRMAKYRRYSYNGV